MSSWSEWFVTPARVVKTLYWSSKCDVQFNSAVVQLWKPVWKVQMLTFVCQVNAGWCFGSRSTTLPSRVLKEVLLLGKAPVIQCFCTFVCMWVSTASSKPNIYMTTFIHPYLSCTCWVLTGWVVENTREVSVMRSRHAHPHDVCELLLLFSGFLVHCTHGDIPAYTDV